MGLFDDIDVDIHAENMSELDAVMVVAFGAAASDGSVTEKEVERIGFLAVTHSGLRFEDMPVITGKMQKIAGLLSKSDPLSIIQVVIDILNSDMRETAFAWAVEIALADGWLSEDEKTFLENVCSTLGIDPTTAKKIIEVIKIKRRQPKVF